MVRWDITGSWVGEYFYHPSPAFPTLPPGSGFTLTTTRGWFGRFRGFVQDDPATGAPVEADVTGWVFGKTVRFRKQYRAFYINLGVRRVTLREHLELDHGMPLDRDVPARPIRYSGTYDPEEDVITGTWRISSGQIRIRSRGRIFHIPVPVLTGSWSMRRQSD